jgi:hypothetical protein
MTRGTYPLSCYMAQGHVWPSCITLGVPDPFSVMWMKYVVDGHGSYYKSLKYPQYMIFNISLSDTRMINYNQWRSYNLSVTGRNLWRWEQFFRFIDQNQAALSPSKACGAWTYHSHLSRVVVKNTWSFASTLYYILMLWFFDRETTFPFHHTHFKSRRVSRYICISDE